MLGVSSRDIGRLAMVVRETIMCRTFCVKRTAAVTQLTLKHSSLNSHRIHFHEKLSLHVEQRPHRERKMWHPSRSQANWLPRGPQGSISATSRLSRKCLRFSSTWWVIRLEVGFSNAKYASRPTWSKTSSQGAFMNLVKTTSGYWTLHYNVPQPFPWLQYVRINREF